jgi:hypothetical protein
MTLRQFSVINEGFTCEYCDKQVMPSKSSCRNHCPFCLSSKHLDNNPGDRQNHCHGQMQAIDYENSPKGIVLFFKCLECGFQNKNKSAYGDSLQSDSFAAILACGSKNIHHRK